MAFSVSLVIVAVMLLSINPWVVKYQLPDTVHAQGAGEMAGHTETLAVDSIFGRGSSLAIDSLGRSHISFIEPGYHVFSNRLRYAVELEPGLWQFEVLTDWGNLIGDATSLALDDAGNPHIGYTHNGRLSYARRSDGIWQFEEVDGVLSSGDALMLLLDSDGQPHVVSTGGGIVYVHKTELGWQTSEIPVSGTDHRYVTLVLDMYNRPHVGFMREFMDPAEAVHGILYYATLQNDIWQIEEVDDGGGGWHPALALDSTGRAHFSYQSGGYNELGGVYKLSYAQRTTAAPTPGEWQIEEIDEDGEGESRLLLDGDGRPHISYTAYVRTYATKNGTDWRKMEIDYRFGKCISDELWTLDNIERPVLSCINEGLEMITWSPAPVYRLWTPAVYC
jgi:hypothetical protein